MHADSSICHLRDAENLLTGAENRPFSLVPRSAGEPCSQHAAMWPEETAKLGGTCRLQMSMAYGHRGWKRHPLGGALRLGGAPRSPSFTASARSGSGAAESKSCVYGCAGWSVKVTLGAASTSCPAYMTTIVSAR